MDLVDAVEQHAATPDIRVIVITGGSSVFAAGADIKEMADVSSVDMLLHKNPGPFFHRLRGISKPMIAAVVVMRSAVAVSWPCCATSSVAADTARFGQPEINLGLMPGGGGTQRLTRAIGKSLAMDVVLSGRMLTADEALAHGLAARLVPRDSLLAESVYYHLDELLTDEQQRALKSRVPRVHRPRGCANYQ